METSVFLARLIGPLFLVMGAGMVVGSQGYRDIVHEFLESRALIYIAGVLAFVPGLAIVLTHNVWVFDWRLIVTILGWLGLIGGAFRILFPDQVKAIGTAMLENAEWLRGGGVVAIVLGAVLAYYGFVS